MIFEPDFEALLHVLELELEKHKMRNRKLTRDCGTIWTSGLEFKINTPKNYEKIFLKKLITARIITIMQKNIWSVLIDGNREPPIKKFVYKRVSHI